MKLRRSELSARRCVIGIAGGSGSGKTTFARKVLHAAIRAGVPGQILSLDNYYRPLDHLALQDRKAYNFDHPDAIDFDLALEHLRRLRGGSSVRQPIYDFKVHTRKKSTVLVRSAPLILVEGLYALHQAEFLNLYDYRLFVSTGLATAVLRRMARDVVERGRDVESSKHQILSTVLPMYETYVKPTRRNAHFSVNWEGEEIPEKATEGLVRMIRDHFR
ncbi:MAG: uridine kinase [Proteobacteria bacterium]|nr:uridine kinase [Pseudomonadota bacterium]